MKNFNLIYRLVFSAALVLATAGAITLSAQTAPPVTLTARDSAALSGTMDPDKGNRTKPVTAPLASARQVETTRPVETPAPATKTPVDEVKHVVDVTDSVPVIASTVTPIALPFNRPRSLPQSGTDDRWHFQLTPYLWLAGLHGTTGTDGRPVGLDMSFSDVFDHLKFAFMGTFEARRNKFSIVVDTQYVHLEDDTATPGPFFSGVEADVRTFVFDPELGYRIFEDSDKGAFIDVMGGIRVVKVSTEFDFFPGILPGFELDASRTWVDGVAGMRGKAHLSPKFFVTGKFDLGGGGSNFTYQLFGAGGFQINPTVSLLFGYRVLDINYRKDNFVYDTSQRGPIMGVGFKF